jgi:dimethylaniline monooxygenase (N-oxide forming)
VDRNGDETKERTFDCSHIAVCTGLHVEPNIPDIPGIENVQGDVFHSSLYKGRDQVAGKRVLILGCGETAMGEFIPADQNYLSNVLEDIAYESIKADAESVTMCFRTGFLSFPKQLSRFQVFGKAFSGGLPIDGLITNLFETAYVHRAVAQSRLRWFISDFVVKRVLWFLTGTQAGMNQHVGALPKERLGRAFVFLNKSNKAMPYLNRPYKTHNPFLAFIGNRYIDPPEDAASDRAVDTCTWPKSIDATGRVHFQPNHDRKDWQRLKNKNIQPNCVIYCSGYVFHQLFRPAMSKLIPTSQIQANIPLPRLVISHGIRCPNPKHHQPVASRHRLHRLRPSRRWRNPSHSRAASHVVDCPHHRTHEYAHRPSPLSSSCC